MFPDNGPEPESVEHVAHNQLREPKHERSFPAFPRSAQQYGHPGSTSFSSLGANSESDVASQSNENAEGKFVISESDDAFRSNENDALEERPRVSEAGDNDEVDGFRVDEECLLPGS